MYTSYVRLTNDNPYTALDATPQNSLGVIYAPPAPTGLVTTPPGYGAQPVVKYVYYNSTTNPAPVAGSAPVYYTDDTFTTVSGNAAEAYVTTAGVSIAGYLCVNTTSYTGLTAAILNQSYCWVQIGGFLANAWSATAGTAGGAAGDLIVGTTTGNWASSAGSAASASRILGVQLTATASSVCTVLVGGMTTFWGS